MLSNLTIKNMCEGSNRPGQGYYWEEGLHEMMAERLGPILVIPSFEASTLHKAALEKVQDL
jgi:hypothetical protein